MKKVMLAMVLTVICAMPAMAQEKAGYGNRDPKKMSAAIAKKLNFTNDQSMQLKELNKKYPGAEFDKAKYREEFRNIMTEDQKKQLAEFRAKREGARGNRHFGNR